jgi:hypothetical protein
MMDSALSKSDSKRVRGEVVVGVSAAASDNSLLQHDGDRVRV